MRGYLNWILIKFQTFSFKKMHMCCMQIASINQRIKAQWQHLGRHWFSYWLSPAWEDLWYRDKSESCFPYYSWIPESLIFTLDADGYCRRSLRPSVRPERRYHSNALRISTWNLAEWYTVPWRRPLFNMAMLGQFLRVLRNFKIFHGRLGPGRWPIMEMQGNHIMAWNLVAWCSVPLKWITIWNGHAQPIFAFSDCGPPRVLSFSKRFAV